MVEEETIFIWLCLSLSLLINMKTFFLGIVVNY